MMIDSMETTNNYDFMETTNDYDLGDDVVDVNDIVVDVNTVEWILEATKQIRPVLPINIAFSSPKSDMSGVAAPPVSLAGSPTLNVEKTLLTREYQLRPEK